MAAPSFNIPDIINERWVATRAFVLQKPITAAVYDVALKIFGLYCQSYFYPIGVSLAMCLITASIVFDFAICGQIIEYKTRFFTSFEETPRNIWTQISDFYHGQLTIFQQNYLNGIFTVTRASSDH